MAVEAPDLTDTRRRSAVDVVFFAVGWPGNVDQLSLETAGITARGSTIPVDAFLRTEVDHIFAVGDVNGHAMLVQMARLEGRIAAENALARDRAAGSPTTWSPAPVSPTRSTDRSA